MERKLPNWLEGYMEYTENTESSPIFNQWVGISTIASALRKKVWLDVGRLKVFPNLYIVLVAEPGIARKSQAISYANDLVYNIPEIKTSADSVTPQALIQDLEDSTCYDHIPGIGTIRHASLSVISKEFESFLGSAGNSTKMLVTLTDLFDAGENPWKHRTKGSGNSTIASVFLNILGATTPKSLETSLSSLAIGGGLTSRIIFVYSGLKHKKIAIPELTPRLKSLKQDLIYDLNCIAKISGNFEFEEEALKYWVDWYENYDETDSKRIQPRKEFDGWYSRKPLMLQKVALCIAASTGNSNKITMKHIEDSLTLFPKVEEGMGHIFTEEGNTVKASISRNTPKILSYIQRHPGIGDKQLLQYVWRDMSEDELDEAIESLRSSGKIRIEFVDSKGKEGIFYYES